MVRTRIRPALFALCLLVASSGGTAAQQQPYHPATVTAEDYARAEGHLAANMNPLVLGGAVTPHFFDGDRMWYRNAVSGGHEFVVVDPDRKQRGRAFDHAAMARALSAASGQAFNALGLPEDGEITSGGAAFQVDGRRFLCDLGARLCTPSEAKEALGRDYVVSPDGAKAAFRRDNNLWVLDVATGRETQLTTDGIEDYGYATDNAGWTKSDRPVVLWSPDSKKIATFQHDGRGVGSMYLVSTRAGHPTLEAWKYPLPEDSVIFRISRVVVHVDGPRVVRLKMPPDQHRSTICDHIMCGGAFSDVEWSSDSKQFAFVSSSRDHKSATLRMADPETGDVRTVMNETVETFFESGFNKVNWHVLTSSNEVLWWSQRSDWGHLYLFDLATGQLKRQVTRGDWNVLQVLKVDEKSRTLYFTGAGREPGDPYFQYFYSVNMDKGDVRLLTPDSANHTITLAPSGDSFVDVWSTPVIPPTSVVRDLRGRQVVALEKADITGLMAAGWTAPEPFSVKARDGETDLYGILYRPSDFDPSKKYPVVNYIYPGPQTGSVGSRSFSAARRDHQGLAELGFIVVELDAMGTPMRSKSFHAAYYGNMGDNGLPDQVGGIRQLAERYPWMDLDRVGIWGHSGGGFASADGILSYPDFYKVAWSESGNHDNRIYEDDWGEKWQGLLTVNPDGSTSYDNQANQLKVENLEGKLMLVHGTMDSNVPPDNTLQMVDRLMEANKDFDLLMVPNQRHGYGPDTPYIMRRRWDYLVKNLLGAEPPKEYEMGGRRPIS